MSISLQALGIDRMSIEDRLELINAIWSSIPNSAELTPPINEELSQELDRRMEDHLASPDDVVSWDEVKAATLARLKDGQ